VGQLCWVDLLKEIEALTDYMNAKELLRIHTGLTTTAAAGNFRTDLTATNDRLWRRTNEIILAQGPNITGLAAQWRQMIGLTQKIEISAAQTAAIPQWGAIIRGSEQP
jgi:hypothetical protein